MIKKIILFVIFVAIGMFVIFKYSDHNLNRTIQACMVAQKQTSETFDAEKSKKFCKEKIKKQKKKFNIVIDVNQNTIPNEKDIRSIIDYEKIITKIEKITKSTRYNFLESLAENSFKEIFEDKRINSVKIKIEKPDAIKNADSVGVEVFKSRSDYEGS